MKTPLAELHAAAGARLIEFAGWEMPVHYGSQLDEHHAVRNHAGCFDVSHMAVVDVNDQHGEQLLRHLLVSDVAKLKVGNAIYTLMLNDRGGIVDDLIAYRRADGFRLVVNAGTTEKDLTWLTRAERELGLNCDIQHHRELCIVAVQGPQAIACVRELLRFDELTQLHSFSFTEHEGYFIARTGYTGEDGVEIICSPEAACELWEGLVEIGVRPAGLGARDSLRLEAGLNLYGHDMNDDTNPFECRVAWTIDWEDEQRSFIGRAAIEQVRDQGAATKLVGLKMTERGIPREGFTVLSDAGVGVVTSGSFSPTLGQGIALARVPTTMHGSCRIQVRKREIPAKIARLPFVRKNKQDLT